MSKGIEYGQPRDELKEFLWLQFVLMVFEKQGRQNDPEAKVLSAKIAKKFRNLSAEEKTFLTMREKLNDAPEDVKLPKPSRFCKHETCGG